MLFRSSVAQQKEKQVEHHSHAERECESVEAEAERMFRDEAGHRLGARLEPALDGGQVDEAEAVERCSCPRGQSLSDALAVSGEVDSARADVGVQGPGLTQQGSREQDQRNADPDDARKKGRERPMSATLPAAPDSSGDVSLLDRIPDSAPSPLERVEAASRAALLRKAMRDLPEGMREALVLFYVEGLGYDTIAKRMNIPLGTVATWIARGRKTLSERMVSLERSRS